MWKSFFAAALVVFSPGIPAAEIPTQLEVRWRPPTENTDGSPLTDLAGYDIELFYTGGASIDITNAGRNAMHVDFPVLAITIGKPIQARVRACDAATDAVGNPRPNCSGWRVSPEVLVGTLPLDTIAPKRPAAAKINIQ